MSKTAEIFTPKTKQYLKIAGLVIITYVAYRQGKKLFELIKTAQRNKLINTTVPGATPGAATIDTGGAAAQLYDAMYNNDWFGWTEDEDRVVELINQIPQAYISDVEKIYFKLYGKVLKEDIIKYCSQSDIDKIAITL